MSVNAISKRQAYSIVTALTCGATSEQIIAKCRSFGYSVDWELVAELKKCIVKGGYCNPAKFNALCEKRGIYGVM